jgi:hypothetical protein
MDLEFVDLIVATSGGAGGQRRKRRDQVTAPINRIATRTDPSLYMLLRSSFGLTSFALLELALPAVCTTAYAPHDVCLLTCDPVPFPPASRAHPSPRPPGRAGLPQLGPPTGATPTPAPPVLL